MNIDIMCLGTSASAGCVVEQLEAAGFFTDSLPKSRLFVSVHDAVLHVLGTRGPGDFVLVSSLL